MAAAASAVRTEGEEEEEEDFSADVWVLVAGSSFVRSGFPFRFAGQTEWDVLDRRECVELAGQWPFTGWESVLNPPQEALSLVCEPGRFRSLRERIALMLFETNDQSALAMPPLPSLAALGALARNCVVVSPGRRTTTVAVVLDGATVASCELELGARTVLAGLKEFMPFTGRDLPPKAEVELLSRLETPAFAGEAVAVKKENRSWTVPTSDSSAGQSYSLDYETYTSAMEAYFAEGGAKDYMSRDGRGHVAAGIVNLVLQTVPTQEMREEVFGHLVVEGGLGCVSGFRVRLLNEVAAFLTAAKPITQRLAAASAIAAAAGGGPALDDAEEVEAAADFPALAAAVQLADAAVSGDPALVAWEGACRLVKSKRLLSHEMALKEIYDELGPEKFVKRFFGHEGIHPEVFECVSAPGRAVKAARAG